MDRAEANTRSANQSEPGTGESLSLPMEARNRSDPSRDRIAQFLSTQNDHLHHYTVSQNRR